MSLCEIFIRPVYLWLLVNDHPWWTVSSLSRGLAEVLNTCCRWSFCVRSKCFWFYNKQVLLFIRLLSMWWQTSNSPLLTPKHWFLWETTSNSKLLHKINIQLLVTQQKVQNFRQISDPSNTTRLHSTEDIHCSLIGVWPVEGLTNCLQTLVCALPVCFDE